MEKGNLLILSSTILLALSACGGSGSSSSSSSAATSAESSSATSVASSSSAGTSSNATSSSKEANAYTVTWKNYDGSVLEVDNRVPEGTMPHYDGKTPVRPNDSQHSYTWNGWTPALSLVTADQVYTATFTSSKLVTEYTITYNLDGGTNSPNNPSSYVPGTTITFADATKTGYAFAGWFDNAGKQVTGIGPDTTGNLVLTAHWTANKNTLSVTSEDTSKGTVAITSGSGYSGESITVTATPAAYYEFVAWYSEGTKVSEQATYTFTMPTNDYSLVARFSYDYDQAIRHGILPHLSEDAKTMTYGLYPQDNVGDSTTVAALNRLTKPESNGWYLYNGDYYAKLVATPKKKDYQFDNGTKIVSGTTYWFKCSPITWNVLTIEQGRYLLLTSKILDIHCFHDSQENRTIGSEYVNPNNYQYSDMRAWLNGYDGSGYSVTDYSSGGNFYKTAFGLGDSFIQTTTVDNSAASTNSIYNHFWCDDTEDKVFLPSYQDCVNSDYGFPSDESRRSKTTDWARARGIYYSTMSSYRYMSSYWTRSPDTYSRSVYTSWVVCDFGGIGFDQVDYGGDGIRPAINVKLS